MRVFDMSRSDVVDFYDKQVKEAYETWLNAIALEFPQNQILAIETELAERIDMANRVRRIHEAAKKRHGHIRKHK